MSKAALKVAAVLGVALVLAVTSLTAAASTFDVRTRLTGYQEVPAVSTTGHGKFTARVTESGKIKYRLRYADLEGAVQQAHLHFGQKGVSAAISVFLCTNLGNGPAGTQPCPAAPAVIEGTLTADDVTNLADVQGISAGEFAELRRAIRHGLVYVNVHSTRWPGGEARGQLKVVD